MCTTTLPKIWRTISSGHCCLSWLFTRQLGGRLYVSPERIESISVWFAMQLWCGQWSLMLSQTQILSCSTLKFIEIIPLISWPCWSLQRFVSATSAQRHHATTIRTAPQSPRWAYVTVWWGGRDISVFLAFPGNWNSGLVSWSMLVILGFHCSITDGWWVRVAARVFLTQNNLHLLLFPLLLGRWPWVLAS